MSAKKSQYAVAYIEGMENLCCTENQRRLFNKGFYWAVMDRQSTVVSLHLKEGNANSACRNRNDIKG
jgi:hypothetical protein